MATLKKSARQRLRDFANRIPTSDEREDTLFSLRDQPDATCILVATELLDLALKETIIGSLREDDRDEIEALFNRQKDGFLTSYAIRTRMAYALNVFGPQTFKDLDTIRRVRNAFAHTKTPITFKNEDVVELCKTFNVMRVATREDEAMFEKEGAKVFFTVACFFIYHGIKNAPLDRFERWESDGKIVRPMPYDGLWVRKETRTGIAAAIVTHRLP